jgi:hypothetical protein
VVKLNSNQWKIVYVVRFVFCQIEVSATGRSLIQRSPTECGVSECDQEASITKRPWPTMLLRHGKNKIFSKICPAVVSFLEIGPVMILLCLVASVNFAVCCEYFLADNCVCVCVCVVGGCVCVLLAVVSFVKNFAVYNATLLSDKSTLYVRVTLYCWYLMVL